MVLAVQPVKRRPFDRLRRRLCAYRGHPAHILTPMPTPFCGIEEVVDQVQRYTEDKQAQILYASIAVAVMTFINQPASERLYCPDCDRKFGYYELLERTPLW